MFDILVLQRGTFQHVQPASPLSKMRSCRLWNLFAKNIECSRQICARMRRLLRTESQTSSIQNIVTAFLFYIDVNVFCRSFQNEVLTSEERVRLMRQTLTQTRRPSPAANVTFAASPSVLNCEELAPSDVDRKSPSDEFQYILGVSDDVNDETRNEFYYEHVS